MKQRILAVDDEIHMLKLLERIITEKTPYEIVTTNNSLEVPTILESQKFDLIIVDLKMPGMDGLDLLRFVKEKERPEEVIMITAFGTMESAIEALAYNVFDYITKPFKKEQIIFSIGRGMRWQRMKQRAEHLKTMFGLEPYTQAEAIFKKEYVQNLAKVTDGGRAEMLRRSGLCEEEINGLLDETEADKQ